MKAQINISDLWKSGSNVVVLVRYYATYCRNINMISDGTMDLLEEADRLKIEGSTAAYEDEFNYMEDKIDRVNEILGAVNLTEDDLTDLENELKIIK